MTATEQQLDFTEMFAEAPGFRLDKLEIYNWGTFDGRVQVFSPHGGTALLTGESGSGKSTLVDALITLLIAPRKVAYNKAADASARERSLKTYVRGYYGQKKGLEGQGLSEALRGFDSYSVILAAFIDQATRHVVTLAKAFHFVKTDQQPVPLYVIARRKLGIVEDFFLEGDDFASLKRRFKQQEDVQVFDDYTHYVEQLCLVLGIERVQALDLFQQTVAMKKVEELTGFVRTSMLADPEMTPEIDRLIEHFHDLSSAHEAVKRSREQIDLLKPLVKDGRKRLDKLAEKDRIDAARSALAPWFATRKLALIQTQMEKQVLRQQAVEASLEQSTSLRDTLDADIDAVKAEIRGSGGEALEQLRVETQRHEFDLKRIQARRQEYVQHAECLGLPAPEVENGFLDNLRNLPALTSREQAGQAGQDTAVQTIHVAMDKVTTQQEVLEIELESLRTRSSSLPSAQIRLRERLCEATGVPASELPYVGELLEVRLDEVRWEGAIERLLHSFGLSLLVPDEHYSAVSQWVESNDLTTRLVYYHAQAGKQPKRVEGHINATVKSKLRIKPDSPFYGWLSDELGRRFGHRCVEDLAAFRREVDAITVAGQVKTGGIRHEKDDRFDLGDRKRYILGFSNANKIASLEAERDRLLAAQQKLTTDLAGARRLLDEAYARLQAIQMLQSFHTFGEIDAASIVTALEDIRERRRQLEQGNDVLAALERRLGELTAQKVSAATRHESLAKQAGSIERELENLQEMREVTESALNLVAHELLEAQDGFLTEHAAAALGAQPITLANADNLHTYYSEWLSEQIERIMGTADRLGNAIIGRMKEFNSRYEVEAREMDADVEALSEYQRLLDRLLKDDLPRFERRFKELLNEGIINQIALFQARLGEAQNQIRHRIGQINSSLLDIDYNPGRYIMLEYEDALDSEIRDFRAQLRACTEGALSGAENEQYSETKFELVSSIIERFRGRPAETERDRRWTAKVTDVRNWFTFAASERWRESNEEYEHYTDSGGKSGGEKEKLAYMILAASLVYHYGLSEDEARKHSFRLVVIDEAFLKSSDESAKFGLELFRKLDLQLLIVTPLLKIHTIEPYITHVGFVHHDDATHRSALRNLSVEDFAQERRARESALRDGGEGASNGKLD